MNATEALAEIQLLAGRRWIRYTGHAFTRMDKRGASRDDVRNALLTATSARWQADEGTWKVDGGHDREGDELTVAVSIEADVVVVTLF
ncbi:MAG TPA: DUF4258 domain-containing protein [Kofleriaceae bacterium]|nr:DUF4258 domain-containing protein [Kofleriaceae bacterium]